MLNRAIMMGRLTRDPELKKTASGTSIASFAIAVDDSRKNADGSKNTLFLNCSLFGARAETFMKFFRKGSLIVVEGRLTQRKYTRRADNVEITVVELNVDNFEFGGDKPQGVDVSGYAPNAPAGNDISQPMPESKGNLDSIDIVDDDLPF